jgi:hypothetical protein
MEIARALSAAAAAMGKEDQARQGLGQQEYPGQGILRQGNGNGPLFRRSGCWHGNSGVRDGFHTTIPIMKWI